ncbi:hypothetical protein ASG31_12175 [Chryseobacterium sp. Leaf404]|nr:hypothetical protein ASG31_12175 [Chryseobacterium sp. Leaf404]
MNISAHVKFNIQFKLISLQLNVIIQIPVNKGFQKILGIKNKKKLLFFVFYQRIFTFSLNHINFRFYRNIV